VVEAIFEGLLLRGQSHSDSEQLTLFDDSFYKPQKDQLFKQWEAAQDREKRSRTMFAQETIKVEEVAQELRAVRSAIGSGVDVESFTQEALKIYGGTVQAERKGILFNLKETPKALQEAIGGYEQFQARFELPVQDSQLYLSRTHPVVEGLATHVMDSALDALGNSVAKRCGVIRTRQVERRTTLLLMRFRYHILTKRGEMEHPLLAEDCQLLVFAGSPQNAEWLDSAMAEDLLQARSDANIGADQARDFLQKVIDNFDHLRPHLERVAESRGQELLDAHRRVRTAARMKGVSYRVEPQLPPDVLGIFIYLPSLPS
jgi:hypothetical protein